MPSDMLTSALAIYDSTADKVTLSDFVKDNLAVVFDHCGIIYDQHPWHDPYTFKKRQEKAEAAAKLAANDTQKAQ